MQQQPSQDSGDSGTSNGSEKPRVVIDLSKETVFYKPTLPQRFGNLNVCAYTHIGTRHNQEDRFVCAPNLLGEYGFFGVFDGTVKEHASEWVHKHILPVLVQCPSFLAFHSLSLEEKIKDRKLLPEALRQCYLKTDEHLLRWCAQKGYDYTACTSVTVLIHLASAVMYVAHVGDSHAVIGSERPSTVAHRLDKTHPIFSLDSALQLTMEHKPNQPGERARIERCGGRLIYLKNHRPFIRGGDFGQRDHAMQLNYSRAFGGKDLKMYGLSVEPDLAVVPLKVADTVVESAREAIRKRDAAAATAAAVSGENGPRPDPSMDQKEEMEEQEQLRVQGHPPASTSDHPEQQQQQSDHDPLYTRCILLGSDGLWDIMSPNAAVNTAAAFHEYYEKVMANQPPVLSPYEQSERPLCSAERLVQCALSNDHQKSSTDNVTAICIFVEPDGAEMTARNWKAEWAAKTAQERQAPVAEHNNNNNNDR